MTYQCPCLWQSLPIPGTTACWYSISPQETPPPETPYWAAWRTEKRGKEKHMRLWDVERKNPFPECFLYLPTPLLLNNNMINWDRSSVSYLGLHKQLLSIGPFCVFAFHSTAFLRDHALGQGFSTQPWASKSTFLQTFAPTLIKLTWPITLNYPEDRDIAQVCLIRVGETRWRKVDLEGQRCEPCTR